MDSQQRTFTTFSYQLMTNFSFFSIASVSKSLLIVRGTLPLPCKDGRGKYRFAGIPMHSRKDLENLQFSILSTAREFKGNLPALMSNKRTKLYRGKCGRMPRTSRFSLPDMEIALKRDLLFPLPCKLYCAAGCPCQGSW